MASLGVVIRVAGAVIEGIDRPYENFYVLIGIKIIIGTMDVIMGILFVDGFYQIRDTGGRVYQRIAVAVFIQMVHPHILILFSIFIVEAEHLLTLGIMDVLEISAREFKHRGCFAILKCIN